MMKKKVIATAAAAALVIGGLGTYGLLSSDQVASIVLLDVNPSIELRVDKTSEVIEVNALNDDADEVLEGMRLEGTDVNTATNALIGSLLKHGYIDEIANSILVSVQDDDQVRGEQLQEELTKEINEILSATSVNAAILGQYMDNDDADDIAERYRISEGKAELILNIMEVNSVYEVKDLAELSVNELNLILSNPKNKAADVTSTGAANGKEYVGEAKAKEIALAHAEVQESNVREMEVEFDYEYGTMVYEVEFASGEYEYDYSVNAKTGEVLHSHREFDDDYKAPVETDSDKESKDIGKEKAKAIALEHAGVSESKATLLKVERDYDDGVLEYSVEFRAGNKEYDYEIHGETGKILDYDVDVDDDDDDDDKVASTTETKDIGKAAAKKIALEHAGVSESKVSDLGVERDYDDGVLEYKVEFRAGNKEYDYEIHGETGKILDYDVDVDDVDDDKGSSTTETKDIGKAAAKKIALEHAGVSESKASGLSVERDYDDGVLEYKVEFRAGNKEYDYEIHGETGKILNHDVDVDDDDNDDKATTETKDIGKAKAKAIALEHAGLTESKIRSLEIERDTDDGRIEYSVEFESGKKEYEYEIDGTTGKILDYEIETEDDN